MSGGCNSNLLTKRIILLPHVDKILGKRNRVWVSGDCDGAICGPALALFAVGYPNHSAGYLTDLGDLSASLELL